MIETELGALREQSLTHVKERVALKAILDDKVRALISDIGQSVAELPIEVRLQAAACINHILGSHHEPHCPGLLCLQNTFRSIMLGFVASMAVCKDGWLWQDDGPSGTGTGQIPVACSGWLDYVGR